MKRLTILLALAVLAGCGHSDDLKSYVPMDTTPRAAQAATHVVLLDEAPSDRAYTVIGLIAPPDDAFDSFAETVNGVRKIAAAHGADAVYLTDESHTQGWSFTTGFRAHAGTEDHTSIRAKAIVWKN